ncbi:MAG: hypothetical protein ACFHU9_13435 [Fluviicola sp.]
MDDIFQELIFRQLRYYGVSIFGFTIIATALYLLPGIQALIAYNKKRWLEKRFAATPSTGEAEDKFRADLLEAAEPGQSYPIYKFFKFYFASAGIAVIIIGFLMVILPDDLGPDAIDWMLYIPGLIGAGLYFLYQMAFKGQGLYREIASVFAFVGITITMIIAYGHHEMDEWMRSDILAFLILGVGGLIIWHSKSIFVSYLYMIAVSLAGATVYFTLEDNWLYFLPHLLWVFGIAILYIWIPKLRAAKDIGAKETIFGILFGGMILSLTWTQLSAQSGLLIPSLAIVLPALYIFSKTYYYKADNIIGKPIEIFVISIVIIMATALTVKTAMEGASDSIYLFEEYSFEKQVSYFILIGLIGGIFWMLNTDFNDSDADINPIIALFPLAIFIVSYILGEYGGHYFVFLALLGLGFWYVRQGIEKKDSIRVALGATVFVYTLIFKANDLWAEDMYESKETQGMSLILFGSLLLGAVIYIRSQWNVSGTNDPVQTFKNDSDLLDRNDDNKPLNNSEEQE